MNPVRPAALLLTAALATACAWGSAVATAEAAPQHLVASISDELDQQLDEDQSIDLVAEVVLARGHVDMGPIFLDGAFTLMAHDDTALEGSVWRPLDHVVVRVADAAVLTVPDDPAYAFLGVDPGALVHVVPQTQNDQVVWLGWNTQDPGIMETVDRGVSLALTEVDGPGEMVVYLQDGGFGEPDVLWDSRIGDEQPLYVDVNTHTHANWVFTKPGLYRVGIRATATLLDGTEQSALGTVRFAIGDRAQAERALAAPPLTTAPLADPAAGTDTAGAAAETEASSDPADEAGVSPWWWLGAGAALLAGLALSTAVRGRRVRTRAMEELR